MAKVVNKGLKLRIFPDKNIVVVLEQNIGNSRLFGTISLTDIMNYTSYFNVIIVL